MVACFTSFHKKSKIKERHNEEGGCTQGNQTETMNISYLLLRWWEQTGAFESWSTRTSVKTGFIRRQSCQKECYHVSWNYGSKWLALKKALHFMIIYINAKIAVILLQISKVSPGTHNLSKIMSPSSEPMSPSSKTTHKKSPKLGISFESGSSPKLKKSGL